MTMPPLAPSFAVEPERPSRPSVVTTAGYLLFLLAGLQLVSLLVSIPTYQAMRDVYPEVYKGTPLEDSSDMLATVTMVVGIGIAVLMMAAYFTLGALVLKGKQPARIVTWVVVGLQLCCSGVGVAGSGINMNNFGGGQNANGVDPAEVTRKLEAALPSWSHAVSITMAVIQLLTAIAIIVLLALPAAHPFFRKFDPTAGATTPYPNYPTYPTT
ncbi:MAG: hypothetical protein HOV77_00765 [Hamadaea sp.]|uniref:hypothetical protein n=1 Tax=Hamadaea sp. TaxID=2024425 RepID=UPI00180537BE|nr:hypothetical protein [Hamadaea sp.]NUT17696.1 hypothetical protein [Hamadaea sp.]